MKNQPFATGRFGVEIELNSFDGRDFAKHPLGRGERPEGMDRIAKIVSGLGFPCEIMEWQYNHNPSFWCCKPDSSCGIELCSPVLDSSSKKQLLEVVDALSKEESVVTDKRCSIHIHVEFSGEGHRELAACVLAWWIKFEHVFIDFADPCRKNNFYCRPIGITDLFDSEEEVCAETILKKLSRKHFSANSFHLFNRRRPTIEFRVAEGTKDSHFVDMWTKLILNFVFSSCSAGVPKNYRWLEPFRIFDFLELDSDLESWFSKRLLENALSGDTECFSPKNRSHAVADYCRLPVSGLNIHDEIV